MRAQIGTLIAATSLIQLANGFFGTFIALRAVDEQFGGLLGPVLSAYFVGFTLGAWRSGRIIARVGHIRAYAAFAGLVAAATMSMSLLTDPFLWMVLRAVIGFGAAGAFVTTESWLNSKAAPEQRSRVFAIYMVGTFVALALGQLLINWVAIETPKPFAVIATLFAVALVLVSTARAEAPQLADALSPLPLQQLWAGAPISVIACALAGTITGTFYAVIPAWMQDEGIARDIIARLLFIVVMGGLAAQIPVGLVSDRADRRLVLNALALGFALVALALALLPHTPVVMLPAAAVLGGLMSTLYPVAVSHAHDRMPAEHVVAVSGWLILASGIGSVIGPLIGASLMTFLSLNGVIYFMVACAIALAGAAGYRSLVRKAPPHLRRPFDILAPQAAPLAHEQVSDIASDKMSDDVSD